MYLMQFRSILHNLRSFPLFRFGVLRYALDVLNHLFGKEPFDCVVRF